MAKLNRRTFLGTAVAGVVARVAVLNPASTISLQVYGPVGHGPEAIWKEFPRAGVKRVPANPNFGVGVLPKQRFAGIAEDGSVWMYRGVRG